MQRSVDVAKKGIGTTYPNPCVGCIIVHKNKVISEAYTSPHGCSHAEINAINKIKDKNIFKDCSMYVTLEPCSHYGKTPPCAKEISKYKFKRVIVGTIDSSNKVNGNGVKMMKDNFIDVKVSVLEDECRKLHRNFLTFHTKKRPYIILKWAESSDGFISPEQKKNNEPFWISCKRSRILVHKWRSIENSILVGYNTVISDNPSLTARDFGRKNPKRIVLDPKNTLNHKYNVFNSDSETYKIPKKNNTKKYFDDIIDFMFENEIQSVIVEGGKKTLDLFIENNIWDEARVFVGPIKLKKGTKSPKINGKTISQNRVDSDMLKIILKN